MHEVGMDKDVPTGELALPSQFPEDAETFGRRAGSCAGDGEAMNVLIVDDQPSARAMLRHVIEGIGPDLNVQDFGDPLAALEWSERWDTDLLLLDYRMPSMDGLEFARRFRRPPLHKDVPIVLITVVGDEPVRQAALEAGVIDFLVKPVRPRELRARCRNLLTLRQQGESVKQRARSLERQVLAGMRESDQREREMLFLLARAAEYRDQGSGAHLLRMQRYVGAMAEALGVSDSEAQMYELAAPLYDIGKIGIPDAVLLKRMPLSAEELEVARKHARIGHDILRESSSRFVQLAAGIALHHHECYDGNGYPDGLAGENIPLPARIVGLADVFDAMTSERAWRPAHPVEAAVEFIRAQRGVRFDPACVDAFISVLPRILEIRRAFVGPPPSMRES
jgi:two-component system response regulator RpfG